MKRSFYTLIILFCLISNLNSLVTEPSKSLIKDQAIIFDMRSLEEFRKERPKDSVHLDYEFFIPKLTKKDFSDFIAFLRIIGVTEQTKIFFLINNIDDLIKSSAIGFFLNYLGIKDTFFVEGGFEGWKRAGLPTQSVGRKFLPSNFKSNIDEKSFFINPDKNFIRNKNISVFQCDNFEDYRIKGSNILDIEIFFADGGLKDKDDIKLIMSASLKNHKTILLYPEDSPKTYAIAFLLIKYLEYDNVKILKGDKILWSKLKILE
ncbi:MAG: rhodanese-like domain-containing protein [Proteobacteria bacterium]|nr:rhodanese-like domain-containing protein [Pseudomonadota bacterium]